MMAKPSSPRAPCMTPMFERAIARTPLDHFVICIGSRNRARADSLFARVFSCLAETWTPVSVRALLQTAYAESAALASQLERAPDALRAHQGARPATHLLVRRTAANDYVTVTEVPWPAGGGRPLPAGALVLDGQGRVFGKFAVEELGGAAA